MGLFAAFLTLKNPPGTEQNKNQRQTKFHNVENEVFFKYGSEFAGITPKPRGKDNGRI